MFAVSVAALLLSDWLGGAVGKLPSSAPHWLRMLAVEPYQDALVIGGFTVVLLSLLWVVSAWTLRPLVRASEEAGAAGPTNPEARIRTLSLPTELWPLAGAMNGALDRLAKALRAEQRFVANAAHELRTPLAVLDLRLRRARETGSTDWPAIEQDLATLARRVNQLLDLARLERGGSDAHPVNLARAAREAAAALLPLVEIEGRVLDVDLPESLPIIGRAGDLTDMVRNLLENALRHGAGTISMRAVSEGGDILLWIADAGHGVPITEREAVFAPFRAGQGGGAGLGLAIVREVSRAHGGSACFVDGPGCRVQVRLPARER